MEKIDIFDKNEEFIRHGYRGEFLNKNEFYKFVHIWLIDGDDILIQKRSETRLWAPNMWATNTGVVTSGENELTCCIRELKEEIGIDVTTSDIKLRYKIFGKHNKFSGIGYVFFVKYNGQKIVIDNEEVADYRFIKQCELLELIKNNEFINYGKNGLEYSNYFDKLFSSFNEWRSENE